MARPSCSGIRTLGQCHGQLGEQPFGDEGW